jgi:pectinesterase
VNQTRVLCVTAAMSLLLLMTACHHVSHHTESRGTLDRPVLTADEASRFTPAHYLAQTGSYAHPVSDPWTPDAIPDSVNTAYVVGPQLGVNGATYTSVQQAVNTVARLPASTERVYIKLLPGTYAGTVYVPAGAPPLTLLGAGTNPSQVVISLALDSMISPAVYRSTVNAHGQYQPADPAWYMYDTCASKQKSTVDTICSAVVWSQSDRFQMKNLTVMNTMLDAIGKGTHQGVAVRTDGDRVQLEHVRLIGRQDTFFVNTSNARNEYVTDHISRAYINNSYIEGDVDYVFGRANAVFDHDEFHSVTSRGPGESYVFAPDTMPSEPYGFLVINSKLTGDAGFKGKLKAKLGRAWDQGASKTGYLPGKTANGQVVIRDSSMDASFDRLHPWGSAATTSRQHLGNAQPARNLNDVNYNRLWEYHNVEVTSLGR